MHQHLVSERALPDSGLDQRSLFGRRGSRIADDLLKVNLALLTVGASIALQMGYRYTDMVDEI
jgi:hypothetical protein